MFLSQGYIGIHTHTRVHSRHFIYPWWKYAGVQRDWEENAMSRVSPQTRTGIWSSDCRILLSNVFHHEVTGLTFCLYIHKLTRSSRCCFLSRLSLYSKSRRVSKSVLGAKLPDLERSHNKRLRALRTCYHKGARCEGTCFCILQSLFHVKQPFSCSNIYSIFHSNCRYLQNVSSDVNMHCRILIFGNSDCISIFYCAVIMNIQFAV